MMEGTNESAFEAYRSFTDLLLEGWKNVQQWRQKCVYLGVSGVPSSLSLEFFFELSWEIECRFPTVLHSILRRGRIRGMGGDGNEK